MDGPLLEILAAVGLFVISIVGGYVVRYFRNRKGEVSDNAVDIDKLKDDVRDIKRLLVMLGKRLDKGSAKYHDDDDTAYEELVKDLLTTEILHSRGSCPI